MNLVSFLYLVGIVLFPFYSFSSGGMQLSHMFLLLGSVIFLFKSQFYLVDDLAIKFLFLLSASIFFREFFALIYQFSHIDYIKHVYFIFYNLFIFSFFLSYLVYKGVDKLFIYAIFSSIIVAILPILFQGVNFSVSSGGTRIIGTFNNPNQLGYYSICTFSILTCLFYFKKISIIPYLIFNFFVVLLCVFSLSKAAMVAMALAIAIFCLDYIRFHPKKLILAFTFFLILSYNFISNIDINDLTFVNRISNIGSDNDDSLEGRGYNAILEASGFEIIFGLGIEKVIYFVGHEVHSTFMSIMANYGLVGFVIFCLFIFYIFYNVYEKLGIIKSAVLFIPFFVYGITHNGTRFTIFWIFLALILYFSKYYRQGVLVR